MGRTTRASTRRRLSGRRARPAGQRTRKPATSKKPVNKEEPKDKLKLDLEKIESKISALKNSKDPYAFEATVKQIQAELESRKREFKLPDNQEKLSSEVLSLVEDERTINARLMEMDDERTSVNCEIQSKKELIQTLTGQLNQAKMDLRGLQN